MSERTAVLAGTVVGAAVGAAVAYLFFTDRGRSFRDHLEPTIDNLRDDFERFQKTAMKVSAMASDGVRVFQEFSAARGEGQRPTDTAAH